MAGGIRINIIDIKLYMGRNIYSHQRVVKLVLDMDGIPDIPTREYPGFNEKLLEYFPGLQEHGCSNTCKQGFLKRLADGTYLPHVIEHLAIEIQQCIGYNVTFGKTRLIKGTQLYNIIFAFHSEYIGKDIAENAVDIIQQLLDHKDPKVENRLEQMREKDLQAKPGPSTNAIIHEAMKRGIPVLKLAYGGFIQLGQGKYQKRISATVTDDISCIAVDIACDKTATKMILQEIGIPIPYGYTCTEITQAINIAEKIGYPVVVKPEGGNQGKGVSLNLYNQSEVEDAFNFAKMVDENIIVEKYISGKDYRLLVVGDHVAAASERVPAHVTGDGIHNIQQLIQLINHNQNRGDDHEKPLTKIKIDEMMLSYLKKQGLTYESIPLDHKIVYLKANGNLSTGGSAIDCTEKVHPKNKEIAICVSKLIGLSIAGVDITCPNISIPIQDGNGAVIEVNAAPGIRMHLFPSKGKPRNVAVDIVDMLYPTGSRYSIPLVAITGTNGKTTTTRMIAHILKLYGYIVGMTTTSGVFINDRCVRKGDATGPASAKIVLTDKSVDAAVLETARGGIIRSGLGYDMSDVAVLTNITEDHLGIDEVYTLDDLLFIKSLVIESIKKTGYAVLNADDPVVMQIIPKVRCHIILFSQQEENVAIREHVNHGGSAVVLKGNYIFISTGGILAQVIDIRDIPATYGGRLHHNIENSLASISAAYALKIPIALIEKAMKSFYSDEIQNPGRFNIYNIRDFKVIIDYGHNIAGYKSVIKAAQQFGASRLVGIIGAPGDRDDQCIREIGKISGDGFQHIIIKEDKDLRGRKNGEIIQLLKQGVLQSKLLSCEIECIYSEVEALQQAIKQAQTGDIIIIFYEDLQPIIDIIKDETIMIELKASQG